MLLVPSENMYTLHTIKSTWKIFNLKKLSLDFCRIKNGNKQEHFIHVTSSYFRKVLCRFREKNKNFFRNSKEFLERY